MSALNLANKVMSLVFWALLAVVVYQFYAWFCFNQDLVTAGQVVSTIISYVAQIIR